MRYFIFLSYRGTNYHGWQRQASSSTVQALLEKVLSLKLGEAVTITGAGRTDAGVHALFYCAHFDSGREDLAGNSDFVYGVNSFLPADIAISSIKMVHADASARYDAISRTYIYRITHIKNPFLTDTAWYLPVKPNIDLMNEACRILAAGSDFASFCRSGSDVSTTICRVISARWSEKSDILEFSITADRFLRNMVRAITGSLIDIGLRKMKLSDFALVIEARDRRMAGQSAPAHGLFLAGIDYPDSIFVS